MTVLYDIHITDIRLITYNIGSVGTYTSVHNIFALLTY